MAQAEINNSVATVEDRPVAATAAASPVAALILAALAGASCKQGGYYGAAQVYLAVLLGLVLAVSAADIRRQTGVLRLRLTSGLGPVLLLAGWTLVAAGLHGSLAAGFRLAAAALGVPVVIASCATLSVPAVELVLEVLLLLGAGLGLLGWFGVAAHRAAFAIPGQGLWRGSSTLSYPNAAAALLAVLALLGIALRCQDLRHPDAEVAGRLRRHGVLVTAALLGVGASMSRGGVLALAAGLLTLLLLLGGRSVSAATWLPALGALVALAGLLPSAATSSAARPVPAVLALLAGLAVNLLAGTGRRLLGLRLGLPALVIVALAVTHRRPLSELSRARLNLTSDDRDAAWHAVWHQIALHPVTGSGPGLSRLSWQDPDGALRVFVYAHDEYLQLFAELGLLGLLALGCCLIALGRLLHRWRPVTGTDRSVWAAACAGVLTVAVSCLFDFTAHFPAITLTAAALVGSAGPRLRDRRDKGIPNDRKGEIE